MLLVKQPVNQLKYTDRYTSFSKIIKSSGSNEFEHSGIHIDETVKKVLKIAEGLFLHTLHHAGS